MGGRHRAPQHAHHLRCDPGGFVVIFQAGERATRKGALHQQRAALGIRLQQAYGTIAVAQPQKRNARPRFLLRHPHLQDRRRAIRADHRRDVVKREPSERRQELEFPPTSKRREQVGQLDQPRRASLTEILSDERREIAGNLALVHTPRLLSCMYPSIQSSIIVGLLRYFWLYASDQEAVSTPHSQ